MYDFICLTPHTCASHSLLHYLNFHKEMHLASYQSIQSNFDDILAYERNFRPFISTVGVHTKDYMSPNIVSGVLKASDRRLFIQAVRDPIESFVSQVQTEQLISRINELRKLENAPRVSMKEQIAYAVPRYLCHAKASRVYEADSFDKHIIFDVSEMKGDKVEGLLKKLWIAMCGNADEENLVPNRQYISLGSKLLSDLRKTGGISYREAGIELTILLCPDGDVWQGRYDATLNQFRGWQERLYAFPDINAYLPSLKLSGPIHMCARPSEWCQVHPKLRPKIIERCIPLIEARMRDFEKWYSLASAMTLFTVDDFTPLDKDMLRASIQADVAEFGRRNSAVVEKWDVTNRFMD